MMDKKFFLDFNIKPKYILNREKSFITSTIDKISPIFLREKPDYIINQGDTNTVLASALACNKLSLNMIDNKKFKLVHVESGLRSHDKSMPEEINRIIADQLSDILLVPTPESQKNLIKENISKKKIYIVGNTISDSIKLNKKKINTEILSNLKLKKKDYYLLTLHRPDMVDNKKNLTSVIHPRTQKKIKLFKIKHLYNLKIINPCNYYDFLSLQKNAKIIFTDSGGIQEEACILKTPCITIRKNTERPETLKIKSNLLAGYSLKKINNLLNKMLVSKTKWKNPYGNNVSKKILDILKKNYNQ